MEENIQLLIHAEDGSFPFLTEHLLKTYFNPEDEIVKNHLVVGIAVKDTCVVPLYKEKKMRKKKRKRSDYGTGGLDEISEPKEPSNTSKPTGYTFDAQPLGKLTRLLPGYQSFTLPTFDLLDDAQENMAKEQASKAKKNSKQKSTKNSGNSAQSKITLTFPSVSSTRDRLSLITPNGMQQISAEMYTNTAIKLQSDAVLALYDQAHPEEGKNRKAAATERSKAWLQHCLNMLKESERKIPLWASLSCYDTERAYAETVKNLVENQDCLAGISVAGWHRIEARDERNDLLKRLAKSFNPGVNFSVMSVLNLQQILDAARTGVNVIGSSLPASWARTYKAISLELVPPSQPAAPSSSSTSSFKSLDKNGCIDLSDEIYRHDSSPIVSGCCSLASKYTKSYVHHLIKANELLAQILLFGHNLHQMLLLFRELTNAKKEGTIENVCALIENQLNNVDTKTQALH